MFASVLVLNRGEIARRIVRTLRRLGIRSIAVYSDADREAPHVSEADEAIHLGPSPVGQSYMNLSAIEQALETSGAEALHPGYGLLSESATLARRVAARGVTFVGPPPEALEGLGDKISARALARSVGVEPPPGSTEPIDPSDLSRLTAEAERVGFPVLIKAAAGGGGIGMVLASNTDELGRAARSAADRAQQAFADGRVYLEKYLPRPRHIEVQVIVDRARHAVALGERECSVQRRHQKIVEESPSPAGFFEGIAGEAKRQELFRKALLVVTRAGYVGAATVEFVVDATGTAYFLEVNARLQVEHPLTEMVTGLDLVELQLRVAAGEDLPDAALNPQFRGHAVEARLCAEDPARAFMPQPGRIRRLRFPATSASLRIDAGVVEGNEITAHYDSLLAKVIAHGMTRDEAIQRLARALDAIEIEVEGPKGQRATNRQYLIQILQTPEFGRGDYDTGLVQRHGAKA